MTSLLLDLLHETWVVYKNMERQRYGNNVKIPLLGNFRQSKAPAFEALFKTHFELLKPLEAITAFSSQEDQLNHQQKILAQEKILAEALLKFTITPTAEMAATDVAIAEEKIEAPENSAAALTHAERHGSDVLCDILKIAAEVQLEKLTAVAASEKLQALEIDFFKKFENVSGADYHLHKAQQAIHGITKHRENRLLQHRLLDVEFIRMQQCEEIAKRQIHIAQLENEILTLKAKMYPVAACTESTDVTTLKESFRQYKQDAITRVRGLEAENAALKFQLYNRNVPAKTSDAETPTPEARPRPAAASVAVTTGRLAFPNSAMSGRKGMLFTPSPLPIQSAPTTNEPANLFTSLVRFVSGNSNSQ